MAEKRADRASVQTVGIMAGLAAGFATRKLVTAGWKRVTGKEPPSDPRDPHVSLGEALSRAYPELAAIQAAADGPVYLVGGAVRDLLLGRSRGDVDVVVEGDACAYVEKGGRSLLTFPAAADHPEWVATLSTLVQDGRPVLGLFGG